MQPEALHAEIRRLSALVAALAEKNLRLETELEGLKLNRGNPPRPRSLSPQDFVDPATASGVSIPIRDNPPLPLTGLSQNRFDPDAPHAGSLQNDFNTEQTTAGLAQSVVDPATPYEPALPDYSLPLDRLPRQTRALLEEAQRDLRLSAITPLPSWQAVSRAMVAGPVPKLRWPHKKSLPLLLLVLCRPGNPRIAYPEIQKGTGLSYTGVYKLLQAGMRYGLTYRSGSRHRLTDAGIAVLEAAMKG